jgi:dienelactone hydrolase
MRKRWITSIIVAVLTMTPLANADSLVQQELRIPIHGAGSKGLAAVMVRPDEPGPHPLAVITHGLPRFSDVTGLTPLSMLPQAMEFARRGWTAVVVMRRGYGDSGGKFVEFSTSCSSPSYKGLGTDAAADLRAAIQYLSTLPEVDPARILLIGRSVGGLATVALTADPPPGLIAAISFAGGAGSKGPDQVCSPEVLVNAFGHFGKRSRIPMLWVYSENDLYFSPQLAQRFHKAFTNAGGNASFVVAPPFELDGHNLFSRDGIPLWAPMVDEFLKSQKLVLRTTLLSLPEPPHIVPPARLSVKGKDDFREYLLKPPHKAFALSAGGHYGYSSGQRTEKIATEKALSNCGKFVSGVDRCVLLMVDDREQASVTSGRQSGTEMPK